MILYRTVGAGFTLLARTALHVEVEGELAPEPGTLYVAAHRSHLDLPVLAGGLYPRLRGRPDALPWFVARDDLFLPGFFAHLAPGRIPLSLGIGGMLERVRCVPARPATRMRLVDLCRLQPDLPLDALPYAAELRARRGRPRRARDVLRSRYADVLWRLVERVEAPEAGAAWAARRAQTRADLMRLVSLLRRGESVFLSPEGTPSRDGRVGPVQRGVGVLVRRGRPRRIVPLGVEYGDGRALVRVGDAVEPPREDVESSVRALLRATVGEVAHAV